jgi:hypothetical protein
MVLRARLTESYNFGSDLIEGRENKPHSIFFKVY